MSSAPTQDDAFNAMFGPNGGVAKKYEAHGNKDAATVARANITQQTADKIKQQGARVLQAVETQRSQYRVVVPLDDANTKNPVAHRHTAPISEVRDGIATRI